MYLQRKCDVWCRHRHGDTMVVPSVQTDRVEFEVPNPAVPIHHVPVLCVSMHPRLSHSNNAS